MRIQLSDHFTYRTLLRFSLPSMIMMVFTSIYGVVDGWFVSNFVGSTPFAAVNLVMPVLYFLSGPGYLLGTGGTAVVAATLGQKKRHLANGFFSSLIQTTAAAGIIVLILGQWMLQPALQLFGAQGTLLAESLHYGRIALLGVPFLMLQDAFQSFFAAAEKPRLGLEIIIAAGITNALLDALFIIVLDWGLTGAAAATVLGMAVGGLLPVLYFIRPNTSLLRLGKGIYSARILGRACLNGSSEMVNVAASSLVTFLYNYQLLKWAGPDGVAAYGVVMYLSFIFAAVYIGYAMGASPVIAYHLGAKNREELHNLFRRSMHILAAFSLTTFSITQLFASPLTALFVGYDQHLWAFTLQGMRWYSLAFLFSTFNYFGSAFFTALNNGLVSGLLAFVRTLVLEPLCIIIFPLLYGTTGIWAAFPIAEICTCLITVSTFYRLGSRYGYLH